MMVFHDVFTFDFAMTALVVGAIVALTAAVTAAMCMARGPATPSSFDLPPAARHRHRARRIFDSHHGKPNSVPLMDGMVRRAHHDERKAEVC